MSYENDRRNLANRAHEVLGKDEGETLMEHLPHGGYARFATTEDLESQGSLLRAEIQVLAAELRREIADSARRQTFVILGLVFAMMSAQTALLVSILG